MAASTETHMTIQEFIDRASSGQIFTVEFIKRTTGELRVMNCRRGVTKHLRGGELGYDAAVKKLLTVYDLKSEGYRTVPLDGLVSVKVGGQSYSWNGEALIEL